MGDKNIVYVTSQEKKLGMPFIQKSHLCKFSLEEAQLLSGKTDLKEACDVLHEIGTETIVVTLGGEGTLLSTKNWISA